MIEVKWSMFGAEDPFAPIAQKWVMLVPGLVSSRDVAEDVATIIVEDYLMDEEIWDNEWGLECTSAEVLLEIHSPEEISGTYNVELTRVVKARSLHVEDPRPK